METQIHNVKENFHWKKQLLFVIKITLICQKLHSKKCMYNIFCRWVFFQRLKQIYFKENLRLSGITLLYTQGCFFDRGYCILWFVFYEFLYSKTTCSVFMFCKDFCISVDFNMMKILPCFDFWLDNFLIYLIFIFSFFNVFFASCQNVGFITKIKHSYCIFVF